MIGVRIGVDVQCKLGEEEKVRVLVRREQVEKAIVQLMDGGDETEERRQRATELMEMAKIAIEEGGFSLTNMTLLIQDIMNQVVIQNKQPL
uniref:Uncharacterized protein n=1 Tax=Nelumbo nucifera TaxID=4432 RepID=A0A822ZS85_NELNU|nr:TPA_asm: hypothetical protein HUJ06_004495 [Nelumbo nucifera]